jgi:ABC-type multidrug transport system ATPase subunit/ABC-type multidrug transport system permease subunit
LLANRKQVGVWGGEILINRKDRSYVFNRDSAYVLQDDIHIATLTVEETIKYAAWTRMTEGTTVTQRDKRVKFLLDMMGLNHVKESLVGDPMHKGISGGQLKRLSIAVEIVHLPNLIFLDEPTSGLDSAIALEVMSAVKKLANQGRTCISTIHQPSPEVYALFDRTVLLSNGRLLYSGPADEAAIHFTRQALGYKFDPDQNPAEFIIDVCGGLVNPEGSEFPRLPEELEELYKQSDYCQKPQERLTVVEPEIYTRRHATTKQTQFKMLMHRGWTALIRDHSDIKAAISKNLIVGILIGIVFTGQANISEPFYENGIRTTDAQNMCSLLFFSMMYCLMSNLQAIPALCTRDVVYRRDLNSFGYSAAPYWASSLLSNLPMVVVTHTIYIVLVYTTCQFPSNFGYFMYFYWSTFLANLASYYFALFLAAGTGSAQLAFAVFPITFMFIAMFSGFTIAIDNVPPGWSWAPFISYARWCFEGLMVNEFSRYGSDGDKILEDYSFDNFNKYDSFWIVLLNCFFFMGVSYWAMRPAASKLIRFEDMPPAKPVPPKKERKSGLQEKLLDHEDKFIESINTAFPQRSTYDVAWYRTNTGEVQTSKGCRLVFRNVVYTVTNKINSKIKSQLLKGVSGRAHPGEMCALMGASGAGKSTLLDILAGRKTTGEIVGDILFNGGERTRAVIRSSAYVMQDNVHIGVLTVRQTLHYAAHLRMEEKFDDKVKAARVSKILDMLGLTEHANTLVGNEYIRGISGGQMKRLSIGVEIINLPDLIYLDEPTSGLDSSISYEVMAAVRNLANQNRTVICTIHQPSPMTYFLFDKLLLLAEGRVIYFGPARDVVNYFATSPYAFKYVRGTNPADYVISVAGSFTPSSAGKTITGGELATYYSTGELCKVFMENIDAMLAMDIAAVGVQKSDEEIPLYPTSTLYQLKTLCTRVLVKTKMDSKPVKVTFMR